jgi:STAS-like domain of unknown function (DUF4325)
MQYLLQNVFDPAITINVKEISGAADTWEQGDSIYRRIIALLSEGKDVTISFMGVDTATPSFVNAAFVQLLDIISLDDMKGRIKIINSNKQINAMIKRRLVYSVAS